MRLGSATTTTIVALALAALPRGGVSQQVPAPPVFGAGVDLVRLDVVVLDKEGRPVTGLSREDFTVEEVEGGVRLGFSLKPGCYATSALREFMKNEGTGL